MAKEGGLDILFDVALNIKHGVAAMCISPVSRVDQNYPALRNTARDKNMKTAFNFMRRIPLEALLEILSTADVFMDRHAVMNERHSCLSARRSFGLTCKKVHSVHSTPRFMPIIRIGCAPLCQSLVGCTTTLPRAVGHAVCRAFVQSQVNFPIRFEACSATVYSNKHPD